MSEADDKRLAIIRNAVENTGYVNCEPNPAFLLRLLDAAREENATILAREAYALGCLENELRIGRELDDRATRAETALAEARERVGELETLLCDIRDGLRADGHVWLRAEDGREMGPPVRDFINAALTPPSPDGTETPDA